jgi:hypothetical protein
MIKRYCDSCGADIEVSVNESALITLRVTGMRGRSQDKRTRGRSQDKTFQANVGVTGICSEPGAGGLADLCDGCRLYFINEALSDALGQGPGFEKAE